MNILNQIRDSYFNQKNLPSVESRVVANLQYNNNKSKRSIIIKMEHGLHDHIQGGRTQGL